MNKNLKLKKTKKVRVIKSSEECDEPCEDQETIQIDLSALTGAADPGYNGMVILTGEITEEMGIGFMSNCMDVLLENPEGPLLVGVNSPGGCYRTSMMLVDFLRALPVEVIIYNMGMAFSGGCLVFLAGDKRYAFPHSKFMLHNVLITKATGNRNELKEQGEDLRKHDEEMYKFIIKSTKLKKKEFKKKLDSGDWYFSGAEAVKKGVAHKVNADIMKEMFKSK
jgi:ATP-dependent Clp protease protease subunit